MTLIRFTASAMGRSRFALSPLAETLSTLMALERDTPMAGARRPNPDRHTYVQWRGGDPVRRGLLALVASSKWFPGFYGVVPADGLNTQLAVELGQVRGWSDTRARLEIERSLDASWKRHDTAWVSSSGLTEAAAETALQGWRLFVEPGWRRRRVILERDIMRRAGLLAAYGWQEATQGMTRESSWAEDDALTFSTQHFDDIVLGQEGMIFVPHTASNGSWTCEEPPRYALAYPAWGVGIEHSPSEDAASTLLGAGTATILRALAVPVTPSQLALLLNVSLGTVSGHLKKLRAAGVIEGARVGRTVRYAQSQRGSDLIQALDG